jgi:hypothetical protein
MTRTLSLPPVVPSALQCQAEVRRLEDVQLQQMLDLINARADELRALCADSHLAEPGGLAEALTAVNSGTRNPGAAADLLAKLFAMLGEVKVGAAGGAAGWCGSTGFESAVQLQGCAWSEMPRDMRNVVLTHQVS